MHRPYIPLGVDQQGRVADGQRAPAPAEASSDLLADPPGRTGRRFLRTETVEHLIVGLVACIAIAAGAAHLYSYLKP